MGGKVSIANDKKPCLLSTLLTLVKMTDTSSINDGPLTLTFRYEVFCGRSLLLLATSCDRSTSSTLSE